MIYEVFHFKPDKESSLASLTPEPPTCRVHATYVSCEKRDAASPIQRVAAGFRPPAFYQTNSSHFAQSCQRATRRLASSFRESHVNSKRPSANGRVLRFLFIQQQSARG